MKCNNILLNKEDGIGFITINRPKQLNALDRPTVEELSQAIDLVTADDEIKVIILTGAGDKAFVAGGDITFLKSLTPIKAREFAAFGHAVLRKIESIPKPVIAAINGFCLGGGCELAMACDFSIASTKAKFGQPEVTLGVTAGFGGTQRLPRLIGLGMARQLLYTGDTIDAGEAVRIGLVNAVVPDNELMNYVINIAKRIIAKGQMAVRFSKAAINNGMQTDIDRAMTIEADIFGLCFSTEDQKEGMNAFIEKRAPQFKEK
ncbi:MAG: enoyl-CoA hydratase-related protein [Syntrophomonas sp.]